MAPPRKLLILLHRPGFEAIYQAASISFTAGSIGDAVTVAPFFGGLLTLAGKLPYAEESSAVRARALGLPDPRHMLCEGRKAAGVRLVVCDTALRLAGLDEAQLCPFVDEVVGLAALWRESDGAQIIYI